MNKSHGPSLGAKRRGIHSVRNVDLILVGIRDVQDRLKVIVSVAQACIASEHLCMYVCTYVHTYTRLLHQPYLCKLKQG